MKLSRIKNQLIVTTLVIMLAVSGYISFRVSLNETEKEMVSASVLSEADGDSTSQQSEDGIQELQDMEDAGEAVITSSKITDYVANAKINREQVRAQAKEELQKIIDNESLSSEARQEASNALVAMTTHQETEVAIENLLAAKGFQNVVVTIGDDSVDVVVDLATITDAQLIQIEDVVTRKTEVDRSKIVVTPMRVE